MRFVASTSVIALSIGSLWLASACGGGDDSTPTVVDGGVVEEAAIADAATEAEAEASAPFDAGVDPKMVSGDGFAIVYTADQDIGFDSRPNVSATFDEKGLFTGYNASANEALSIGAATQRSAATDGVSSWGTWVGGPTTGVFYNAKPMGDFTFGKGFHYAIGKKTLIVDVPTSGNASYVLSGASSPTSSTVDDTGSVTSFGMKIDFASGKVGVELSGMMSGTSFGANTMGGLADVSGSEVTLASSGEYSGLAGGPAAFTIRGRLVNNGGGIVVAYVVKRDGGESVNGTASLKKQ